MRMTICTLCSVLLLLSMTLALAGCGAAPEPDQQAAPPQGGTETAEIGDLMEGIVARVPDADTDLTSDGARLTDFALRLFRAGKAEGENSLVSPLSVLCALAMTANGARGETREQMEAVLGMKVEELNDYLYAYMRGLPEEEWCKLSLANSIWFTDDDSFTVNRDFLQTNADYYGADLYKTVFNDGACKAINDWVKEKTDGMIPQILDRVPSDAVMYLVNALAFKADWAEVYREHQVRESEFTREDGSRVTVDLMYGREKDYLETANATGFIKYYAGRQYAFAALLPNEGVTVAELADSLTGTQLHGLLSDPTRGVAVDTAIPKFESKYSAELSQVLAGMGMPLAFSGDKADFTGLGTAEENIFISRVLHKTFISVAEQGTRAGAATVVEMAKNAAMPVKEVKTVILDRPFLYMLVDMRTGTPFFIGTVMDPTK